jgi:hypothetical protein
MGVVNGGTIGVVDASVVVVTTILKTRVGADVVVCAANGVASNKAQRIGFMSV